MLARMPPSVPTQNRKPDRYEPLPGIIDLPGWIWRRLPPVAKVGLVVALVALIAVAVAIGPDIRESKSERERAEQQQRQRAQAVREARIRREQRPQLRGRLAGHLRRGRAAAAARRG